MRDKFGGRSYGNACELVTILRRQVLKATNRNRDGEIVLVAEKVFQNCAYKFSHTRPEHMNHGVKVRKEMEIRKKSSGLR